MSNPLDDRRRGLEEDYFRRKDQEAIEKLREKCGGVWLDSGELQQLTHKEKSGWFGRLWQSGD